MILIILNTIFIPTDQKSDRAMLFIWLIRGSRICRYMRVLVKVRVSERVFVYMREIVRVSSYVSEGESMV